VREGMVSMFDSIKVGDKVVAMTSDIRLPGGTLHEAEVIEISLQRNFFKVRYAGDQEFEEWLPKYKLEKRKGI
jgi:hypothetical protein